MLRSKYSFQNAMIFTDFKFKLHYRKPSELTVEM